MDTTLYVWFTVSVTSNQRDKQPLNDTLRFLFVKMSLIDPVHIMK